MTYNNAANNYSTAKFIVGTSGHANYLTIASAISAASSGDTIFVMPGTYTENLSLKSGVNIAAFSGDAFEPTVTIIGKATYSSAGSVVLSNLRLQTNSDYFLSVTGSSASIVTLTSCFLNMTNNTGIQFTSSSSSAIVYANYCLGNVGTTGISVFSNSSAGQLVFEWTNIRNSGASTTASTTSAGLVAYTWGQQLLPITTSGTASLSLNFYATTLANVTAVTCGGSGGHNIYHSQFDTGTATAITVTGSANIYNTFIASSNTNAIDGAGTIYYENLGWGSTSQKISTTTQNPKQKVVIQTFTSNGTYTPTNGMKYCIVECLGGGGGGGGVAATGASTTAASPGGGGGEYRKGVFSAPTIGTSVSVTINSGGGGGSAGANNGSAGGSVVFGALITANGGSGGTGAPASSTTYFVAGAAGGTGGSGGDVSTNGFSSVSSVFFGNSNFFSPGNGANSQYGSGGLANQNGTGGAASGYGAGGGGTSNSTSQSARAGGAGTTGIVIVTEYVY